MSENRQLFKAGDIIQGYCNGAFGRDDYDSKICVFTADDFAVFQYLNGYRSGQATVLNEVSRWDEETVYNWRKH